jgi:hypothetical protein
MAESPLITELSEEVMILRNKVEDISRAIQQQTREVDFHLYLDSVATSSQRSRSILYLMIISLITTFCAIRQTAVPDWQSTRLARTRAAYEDITFRVKGLLTMDKKQFPHLPRGDRDALGYAARLLRYTPNDPSRHIGDDGFSLLENIRQFANGDKAVPPSEGPVDQLRGYLDEFRKVVLQSRVLNLPIIGIQIDGNDLALIAGTVYTALLYLLGSSFRRERINHNAARLRAQGRDPANLQLLLMAQVLSPAIMSPEPLEKQRKFVRIEKLIADLPLLTAIVLPTLFTGFLCWRDIKDWQIVFILEHRKEGIFDLALQVGFAILTLVLVVATTVPFRRLNAELSELEKSANNAIVRTDSESKGSTGKPDVAPA